MKLKMARIRQNVFSFMKISLKRIIYLISLIPFKPIHRKQPGEVLVAFLNRVFKAGKVVKIKVGPNRGLLWKIPVKT